MYLIVKSVDMKNSAKGGEREKSKWSENSPLFLQASQVRNALSEEVTVAESKK